MTNLKKVLLPKMPEKVRLCKRWFTLARTSSLDYPVNGEWVKSLILYYERGTEDSFEYIRVEFVPTAKGYIARATRGKDWRQPEKSLYFYTGKRLKDLTEIQVWLNLYTIRVKQEMVPSPDSIHRKLNWKLVFA